jgi:hypothetical protein
MFMPADRETARLPPLTSRATLARRASKGFPRFRFGRKYTTTLLMVFACVAIDGRSLAV